MMKIFGSEKLPKWAVTVAAVLVCVILLFSFLAIFTYAYGNIFPGVSAGGVKLGGMTYDEAVAALDSACSERYKDAALTVKLEDAYERKITAEELDLRFSSQDTATAALAVGREGGFFGRIFEVLGVVFGGHEAELSVNMNNDSWNAICAELTKFDVAPVDAAYTVEEETTLVLHPKTDGRRLDTEALMNTIKERFFNEDYSELSATREVAESVSLDIDKVYSEVHKEVTDAHLEKDGEGNKIVPHVVGVDFDLEAAKIAYEKSPDEVIRIPLTLTQPKVLTKHLEVNLFKYCLAEVETHFSPKKVERTANVRLSASLINGTVLNPGEEFSYNKTVGPRTAARGFKAASIFSQGEVVDGIGGGICQTSSTLYMAAVKANMKITERTNHSFYVDYAPKGEDATVVYGSLDFKFKNTSQYPIKIVATSKNNYIRIKLMGTEPDEVRTVKLTKKIHSTTPYTTREKQTADLKLGERKVEQKGQEGLSMTVYRNVYDKKGKLIESYVENKSKYKPMPEIVLVGTAKVSQTEGESVPVTAPEKDPTEAVPPSATEEGAPEQSPEPTPPAEQNPETEATQNQEAAGDATETAEPPQTAE
ncbi:MAG: VanW family protein [Oscillospiraceae bacterium]|nr:VanW family protein [Oscillospiraceae bacterium]